MISSLLSLDLSQSILLADFNLASFVLQILLFAVSLWLIFLVLIQRGKGGGLTGALGGSGGSSAFGAKAGDAFTKVTVVSAAIWIFLCMVTIATINPPPPPEQSVNNDAVIGTSDDLDSPDPGTATGDSGATMGGSDSAAGEDETAPDDGEADNDDSDTSNNFVPADGASSDDAAAGDEDESEDTDAADDDGEAAASDP